MSNTIINTNVSALNSHRSILGLAGRQANSAERLSTGMRINRAADDAAGLAISEGMRNQIRGLDQSVRNSQDGVSMVQTAEGAFEEMHRMIERIRVLNVQGATDTYSQAERNMIAEEVESLIREIRSLETRVEFNGMLILRTLDQNTPFDQPIPDPEDFEWAEGSILDQMLQVGANSGQLLEFDIDMRNTNQGGTFQSAYDLFRVSFISAMSNMLGHTAAALRGSYGDNFLAGSSFNYSGGALPPGSSLAFDQADGGRPGTLPDWDGGDGERYASQQWWISRMIMNVDAVADSVSTFRANLGAFQNRLEHAISNLQVSSENMSASNSRIRDTDMAAEMMRFTQANVLQQAGMSMLAQANMQPNNVLQLLG